MPSQPPNQPGSPGPPGGSQPPRQSRPPPDGDDTPPTEILLSEARRVVDQQIQELDRTDRKAARSLQAMFVMFGLLISAQQFLDPEPVWSLRVDILVWITLGGWIVGLLSMLLAYSSSDGRLGAASTMQNHPGGKTVTSDLVRTRLLEEYSHAVKLNKEMIWINTRLLIFGQMTALIGTVASGLVLLLWL